MKYRLCRSPLGNIIVAGDGEGLRWLEFQRRRDGWFRIPRDWVEDASFPLLLRAEEQLLAYFEGRRRSFSLPLAPVGTPFQQRVWAELRKVPFGETVSYSELARRCGRPSAIRAAGAANGKNPISIVIPCHRVVGKNGALTGYGGGLRKKQALLALERAPVYGVPGHLRPGPSRVHPGVVARQP
jgi:methylated-DNA-[protein]-cysteine S-methyltransferase